MEQVFFSSDPKERVWKVILCKDPCGKQVVGGGESNLINLHMFWIENDERYIGLQALISLLEVTQTTIIIGGVPFMPISLVGVATNGRVPNSDNDNDPDIMSEFVGSSSFDSDGY